ncbi:MAG: hypothetical protein GC192_11795 [Bacteroidetes bacterium]|nr:hypothetical protein [Bacteroidota bacterium]
MKYAVLLFVSLCFLGGTSISEVEENTVDVHLEIRAKEIVLKKGAIPNVEVFLVNKGDKLVNLVQPGDGSLSGKRTPRIMWSWRVIDMPLYKDEYYPYYQKHPEKFPEKFEYFSGCGTYNGLKRSEIITLRPKEEVKLTAWVGQPKIGYLLGKFGIKLFYENKPDIKCGGDPDALEIVRTKTPAVQLESNELIFEVVE